jgi:hypothetical protein
VIEGKVDEELQTRGFSYITGLKCSWAVDSVQNNLASDGFIRVPSDNVAGPKILPFYVSYVPPVDLHQLHCKLTLTDTNGYQAVAEFELLEYDG